jgi:hypothetical protein
VIDITLVLLQDVLTLLSKVTTLEEEFRLTATAINGTRGGCTSEVMAVRNLPVLVEPRTHK